MGAYVIRRLILGLGIIILVSILVFLLMHLLPGDPLILYMTEGQTASLSPEGLETLRHKFGLDKSLPEQYISWIGGVLQGDLGTSIFSMEKVSALIWQSLPITLHLGISAFLVAAILGPIFGTICALRRGKWIDSLLTVLANLGVTTPAFWLGILMIYFFSLRLNWLPVFGYTSPFADFWLSLRQLVMPVICLSIVPVASLTRQTRSNVLEVIRQDYIRTAWSKGLKERTIVMRHVMKNAFIPVVTVMGMHIPIIFSGSVLIETVFSIPGMGRLIVNGMLNQDFQVVQAAILITSAIVVLANLFVDLSYGYLDPRIRFG
jgi:peptide/nickel transport system permease protein